MKNKLLEKLIRDTVDLQIKQDKFTDDLDGLMGLEIESRLFNALHDPIGLAIEYIDSMIDLKAGIPNMGWFSYYIFECSMGAGEYEVTTENGSYVFGPIDVFLNFLEIEYDM